MTPAKATQKPANNAHLDAIGLHKHYRGRRVLEGVDISVQRGEIAGLLGPNGAGKTTAFYIIVGLIRPDRGRIMLGEQSLGGMPMHKRAHYGIGYLPQEPSVFRKLTVADNIRAILQFRRGMNRKQIRARLEELLEELSISHIADSIGINLSGGERRRVEIARALAADPSFMLLDEPFAGIDPIAIGDIRAIIRYLAERGIGVLITDHNVRETLSICDHAFIMAEGTVIASGERHDVVANSRVRQVYLGEDFTL